MFAGTVRQKLWMDLFGVLSPCMTAFAFKADMADMKMEGFDEAKKNADAAKDAVIQQQVVIDNLDKKVEREKTPRGKLEELNQGQLESLEKTKDMLQKQLSN